MEKSGIQFSDMQIGMDGSVKWWGWNGKSRNDRDKIGRVEMIGMKWEE